MSHKLFDAHAHVVCDPEIPTFCCATDESSWARLLKLEGPKGVRAVGIHPWFVEGVEVGWENRLEQLLMTNRSLAVGECGLDCFREIPLEKQVPVFEVQLEMALRFDRPLAVHAVSCWEELCCILKDFSAPKGSLFHRFGGSLEMALFLIERGFFVSVGYEVCARSSKRVRRLLKELPLNKLLIESDAEERSPHYQERLLATVHEIARQRSFTFDETLEQLYQNSRELF